MPYVDTTTVDGIDYDIVSKGIDVTVTEGALTFTNSATVNRNQFDVTQVTVTGSNSVELSGAQKINPQMLSASVTGYNNLTQETIASGFTCTNNGDGTYTLNGTPAASVGWYVDQPTRNVISDLQNYNGRFTIVFERVSGSFNTTYVTSSNKFQFELRTGVESVTHISDSNIKIATSDNWVSRTFTVSNKNVYLHMQTIAYTEYNNYRFRVGIYPADCVPESYVRYVIPTTVSGGVVDASAYVAYYPYLLIKASGATISVDYERTTYSIPTAGEKYDVPAYWDAEIEASIVSIKQHELECKNNLAEFFFITDTHWKENAGHSGEIVGYMSERLEIPLVVFGGDAIYTTAADKGAGIEELRTFFHAYNKGFNLLATIGNHDWNANGIDSSDTEAMAEHEITLPELYTLFSRRVENFGGTRKSLYTSYVDNLDQRVRFIQFHAPYSTEDVTLAEVRQLVTELDDAISVLGGEWTVVLFSHTYWYPTSGDPTTMTVGYWGNRIVSFINGIQTNATIAAWIVGHCHSDHSTTVNGLRIISTSCDIYSQSSVYGGPTMVLGTDTEQCIDCYQIDTHNKKIYITRIGAGDDREYTYGEG